MTPRPGLVSLRFRHFNSAAPSEPHACDQGARVRLCKRGLIESREGWPRELLSFKRIQNARPVRFCSIFFHRT